MAFMLLGILDFSRVFTSLMTVESAAREAADYGAFISSNWIGDPANPGSNRAKTELAMAERACVASRNLNDYVGSGGSCSNPSMTISLINKNGSPANNCEDPNRNPGPCWVHV